MPRWPYRLRRSAGADGVMRSRGGVLERLMHVDASPVRVRCWQTREGYVTSAPSPWTRRWSSTRSSSTRSRRTTPTGRRG
jgi:hypothetical protein